MRKQIFICCALLVGFLSLYGQSRPEPLPTYFPKGSVNVRVNTLTGLVLTPSLGVEYKTSDRVGVLVDGGWARWSLDTPNKYWRIWYVAPQARYYAGRSVDTYLGVQGVMGEYNVKGRQGKYTGGSFTFGRQFTLSKRVLVDLGLSLGGLHFYDREKYRRVDSTDYLEVPLPSTSYWGPTSLTMAFVWNIN